MYMYTANWSYLLSVYQMMPKALDKYFSATEFRATDSYGGLLHLMRKHGNFKLNILLGSVAIRVNCKVLWDL